MIILYFRINSKRSFQAESWFKDHGISVIKRKIEYISRKDLIHILTLSEKGFSDILKQSNGAGKKIHTWAYILNSLTFNEALDYILENKEMLRVPIIFDKQKLTIGYNYEAIRTFIPKEHRRVRLLDRNIASQPQVDKCFEKDMNEKF